MFRISGPYLVWILFSAVAAAYTHDDLIVAVGDQIELLSNGSQSRVLVLESYNASVLVALAHDPSSKKLFFSDRRNRRGHIFSVNFDGVKAEGLVRDVVERGTNESVEGLTYDHLEKALLWTDGLKQSIRRITVDRDDFHTNENNTIELVHLLNGDKPRGLVSDPCTRMLYWTNWNIERPSIERSHLNGSYREVIVQNGLFMPHGLGLDVSQQMIYWANNLRHGTFQIERSLVDGSERQLIYEGKGHELRGQFIFGLTVGEHNLYWTDWDQKTLWSLPKGGSAQGPQALRRYQQKPMAVIVLQNQPLNCQISTTVEIESTNREATDIHPYIEPTSETFQDVTLPQGLRVTTSDALDSELCAGYCFNDGHCFVINSDMRCSCPENYKGDRCELYDPPEAKNVLESCGEYESSFATAAANNTVFTALITLSTLCVVLINAVIFLSFRVWRLSSAKPRFKRRIIREDKHYRPAERVINIEDCCNMNICETPCTEPPSGASLPGQSSDRVKLLNCQF